MVSHLLRAELCQALQLTALSRVITRRLCSTPIPISPQPELPKQLENAHLAAIERAVSARCEGILTQEAVRGLECLRSVRIKYTQDLHVQYVKSQTKEDITREEYKCLFYLQEQLSTLWLVPTNEVMTVYELLSQAISEV